MRETMYAPMAAHSALNGNPRTSCAISGIPTPLRSLVMLRGLRRSLIERIQQDFPALELTEMVSAVEVERYRTLRIEELLLASLDQLTALDRKVKLANRLAGGEGMIDPCPFALLRLLMSSIAALQANVIATQRGKELVQGSGSLQDRIDHLVSNEWKSLVEIQHLQIESMKQDVPPAEGGVLQEPNGLGDSGAQMLT